MMAMMNYPAAPLAALRREFDRLVEGALGFEPLNGGVRPFPALNIWEEGDALVAEAEVPGLSMEDLEVLVQGNELTIKGERREPADEKIVYHRQERGTGQFSRFLNLPVEVDAEKVDASLKNGVLTIRLPKSERAMARKITVRSA